MKLSVDQMEALDRVQEEKGRTDEVIADLKKELRDKIWDAQLPLRAAIRNARKWKVPYKRIGEILRTQDYRTMKAMEEERRND